MPLKQYQTKALKSVIKAFEERTGLKLKGANTIFSRHLEFLADDLVGFHDPEDKLPGIDRNMSGYTIPACKDFNDFYNFMLGLYDTKYNSIIDPEKKQQAKNFVVEFEGLMQEIFRIGYHDYVARDDRDFIYQNLKYGKVTKEKVNTSPFEKIALDTFTNDLALEREMRANGTYNWNGVVQQLNGAYSALETDLQRNGLSNLFDERDNVVTPFEKLCQTYSMAREHYKHLGFPAWLFAFKERSALAKAKATIEQARVGLQDRPKFTGKNFEEFLKSQLKPDSKHDFSVYNIRDKEVPNYGEFDGRKAAEEKAQKEAEIEHEKFKKIEEKVAAQKPVKLARTLTELIVQDKIKDQNYRDSYKNEHPNIEEKDFEYELRHHAEKETWTEIGKKYGKAYGHADSARKQLYEFKNKKNVVEMMKEVNKRVPEERRYPIGHEVPNDERKAYVEDFMKEIDPDLERKMEFMAHQEKEKEEFNKARNDLEFEEAQKRYEEKQKSKEEAKKEPAEIDEEDLGMETFRLDNNDVADFMKDLENSAEKDAPKQEAKQEVVEQDPPQH